MPSTHISNGPEPSRSPRDFAREIVSHHQPDDSAIASITNIRTATAGLIQSILENCPPCADTSAAIRKAREAMMTANAAIVLDR